LLRTQEFNGQQCDLFLNVPTISRWQWHPFSVANAVGYSLTLNIKRYGAFTEALMDTLQSGEACRRSFMLPGACSHIDDN